MVDDEPDVRLVARVVLTAAGFEVQEVDSGLAALEALAGPGAPDVVLLDVRMPGLDGWEVLRRIRDDRGLAALPVVVFTADLLARSEAPPGLRDEDIVLTKPFEADDLLAAVQAAVAGGS